MIDPTHFATGIKATRYKKSETKSVGDQFLVKRFNVKPFTKDDIVYETTEFYFVNRNRSNLKDLPLLVSFDPGWTLLDEIMSERVGHRSNVRDLDRGISQIVPLSLAEVDRALNIAQDMGRWDMAYLMILDLFDLDWLTKSDVLWERFPHRSAMSVIVDNRLFVPTGAMKEVIEKWWALNGGYHGPTKLYAPTPSEYEEFMNGLRNPFLLAGVDKNIAKNKIANSMLPVGYKPEELRAERLVGREWWSHDHVAYLADGDGVVLPYWFVDKNNGKEPSRVGWDLKLRKQLAASMHLPLLLKRQVEQHYERSRQRD